MNMKPSQSGFTLVEIAIVLLIVTILLGYSVAMFPLQQELKQYRHVGAEMDSITQHLIAFAQVNGRLPCPDTGGDVNATGTAGVVDGREDTDDLVNNTTGVAGADGLVDNCKAFFGFLPARTLGINGKFNAAGILIDPWDSGYGYAISQFDAGDGNVDLVTANGIRIEGMANVIPDLFICDDSDELGDDLNCTTVTGNEVIGTNGGVAAVIISLGKDFAIPATSNIQAENIDNFDAGTADKVYIFAPRRDDYDDVVRWLSTNLLFSKMIEADQLP
jgi:prepilin-type N-terminal cleavage/methylation domain-containing protein